MYEYKSMNLADTYRLMTSGLYTDRFRAEYYQTKIRYEKLKDFANKIEAAMLKEEEAPKHRCPLVLLRDQQKAMGQYLHTLELRAEIEGIDL